MDDDATSPLAAHDRALTSAFTAQAEGFNRSSAANDDALLDAMLALAAPRASEDWLEAACGPGVISRRLAPRVRSVHGVDLTPEMVRLARQSAATAGVQNATFTVGDATRTGLADASVNGAITRFSLHHIPVPGRLLEELARIVRPGGTIIVADHLADDDPIALTWSQEIERLRDPSHWASLTHARLHAIAAGAGLRSDGETIVPIELDLGDWLRRGGEDPEVHQLVERLLDDAPPAAVRFRVAGDRTGRTLGLDVWVGRFVR
ncbi:MAG TPA: class I SAM-dependent methyltransferase [Solirubrobacteraceae bacterium]|nr:class I SAM-dependent methyltransferase [Solirubrobacteraceae bacterium]